MAMLLCAGLLAIVAFHKRAVKDRFTYYWLGLSFVSVCMSADEAAAFRRHLPARTRFLFIIAGTTFVSAVQFVEALSYGILGDSRIVRLGIVVVEETMEMVGIAIFAIALLDYLRTHVREITLRFD